MGDEKGLHYGVGSLIILGALPRPIFFSDAIHVCLSQSEFLFRSVSLIDGGHWWYSNIGDK
jgi:hypothetical protein